MSRTLPKLFPKLYANLCPNYAPRLRPFRLRRGVADWKPHHTKADRSQPPKASSIALRTLRWKALLGPQARIPPGIQVPEWASASRLIKSSLPWRPLHHAKCTTRTRPETKRPFTSSSVCIEEQTHTLTLTPPPRPTPTTLRNRPKPRIVQVSSSPPLSLAARCPRPLRRRFPLPCRRLRCSLWPR